MHSNHHIKKNIMKWPSDEPCLNNVKHKIKCGSQVSNSKKQNKPILERGEIQGIQLNFQMSELISLVLYKLSHLNRMSFLGSLQAFEGNLKWILKEAIN